MENKFGFEKLGVYKRALDFTNLVYEITQRFPQEHKYGLADQLRRATLSITLNIAESSGSFHQKEKRQFLNFSRRSCFECVPALRVAHQQGLIQGSTFD